MKRILCLAAIFIMIFKINALAEDFTFDVFDMDVREDEVVLMDSEEDFEAALTKAWDNMEKEIKLYPDIKIHKDDVVGLFSAVCYENPKYYYVEKRFSITANKEGYVGSILNLSYTADNMDEVRGVWAEIDKATEEILFYIDDSMTDFEKIMTVHDYMDLHYVYDITDTDQTYLIMLDKKGVCAAYAETFQHMMNVLDIDCTLVASKAMGHIWNMVKLDNKWYHADVTWDDPVPDMFAHVCHEYMLLSTDAISTLGHYGFDAPYDATSTDYDEASWHDDLSSLVTIGGVMYMNEGNNLIDEEGNIIYKNLDGGDGKWNVSKKSGVSGVVWAGLCEVNNILYFNTDAGIFSYNPVTEEIECVLEEYGIAGIFADGNTIHYSEYDFDKGQFVKKGDLTVSGSFVKSAEIEADEAVVKVYNDSETPLWVVSSGKDYKIHKIAPKEVGIARFENGDEQSVFVWEGNMVPVDRKIELRK